MSANCVTTPPLIHSCGSRGSSCCAATVSTTHRLNCQPTSNDVSSSSKTWSHVYSHRKSNCSRRTQCASVAYSTDGISSSARRSRSHRAKKKLQKQQSLLREVAVSLDKFLFSISYIEDEIIVFDGGNSSCPPITPPKNVKWRRHHVSDLHIDDDSHGDIGLTFRRIDGCLPFIRLPRNLSLDIIGHCDLDNIYEALNACENLRSLLCRSNKKRVSTDSGLLDVICGWFGWNCKSS